jgi:hypothetical protein
MLNIELIYHFFSLSLTLMFDFEFFKDFLMLVKYFRCGLVINFNIA